MLILALDLARNCGWAFGPAGQIPESGSWVLRPSGDPVESQGPELLWRILVLTKDRRPDLIAVEDWMSHTAQKHQSTITAQMLLHGALNGWAGVSHINLHRVAAGTVRRHVCGKGHAGDRNATKAMVLQTVKMLGLIPKDSADDNRADAVAVWRWAEDVLADKRGPLALVSA